MCTLEQRNGNIFILTLTDTTQHRLNPTLISTLRSNLSQIKSQSKPGSVLITISHGRFFSNGFDLIHAQKQSTLTNTSAASELLHMVDLFKGVVSDLLSLPIPTIAAVTGHAAAAGMILAMCHDYVYMISNKSVMYMSELDIGMTLPDYFTALIRGKLGSGKGIRDVVLRAGKVGGEEAKGMGIVDAVFAEREEVLENAVKLGEELGKRKWEGRVYREMRKSLYPEVCALLGLVIEGVMPSKL